MLDAQKLFKRRLYFSIEDDLTLFRLVKANDPFQNRHKWVDILKLMQERTGKPWLMRTMKDRVTHCIKKYVSQDMKFNQAHATSDQWKEKASLLAYLVNLRIQAVSNGSSLNYSQDDLGYSGFADESVDQNGSYDSASNANDFVLVKVESEAEEDDENSNPDNDAADNNDSSEEERKPKYRKPNIDKDSKKNDKPSEETTNKAGLDHFMSRHKEEIELKTRQVKVEEKKLQLQEKQLALDKEKFDLEKMERTQRLETELKERQLHMKLLEQQQQIISTLLEQKKNNQLPC